MIQFCKADIGEEEIEAANRVMRSGWLAAGKETEAFEKEFAEYITPKVRFEVVKDATTIDNVVMKAEKVEPYYCIFTNSCTSALKMAYKWAKEKYHDSGCTDDGCRCTDESEVRIAIPKNTFCATYAAADEIGVDWGWHGNVSGSFKRVNVHYGSIKDATPCLIEDSAHRIEPNDPLVGKIRTYSFYTTKNMTTNGAGGMFITNDKEVYEKARLYWNDGINKSSFQRQHGGWDYQVTAMAGGYDGGDVAAAVGRVQLRRLPGFTQRRNQIRDRYNEAFGQHWLGNHLYPVFVDSQEQVGQLIEYLRAHEIQAGYHYPGTGWLGVSLPIYPLLTDDEQSYIIETMRKWGREKSHLPNT